CCPSPLPARCGARTPPAWRRCPRTSSQPSSPCCRTRGWTILRSVAPRRSAPHTRRTCWTAWRRPAPPWRPLSMPVRRSFDYAIVRVVPRVEREEFLNAGVILFCRTLDYLDARVEFDAQRLAALVAEPDLVMEVARH